MINMTNSILDNLNIFWDDSIKLSKNSSVSYGDLINSIITTSNMDEAVKLLLIPKRSLERVLPIVFPNKPRNIKWYNYLLSISKQKRCSKCTTVQPISEYYLDISKYNLLASVCKLCSIKDKSLYYKINTNTCNLTSKLHYTLNKPYYLARNANRRAFKIQATPYWSEKHLIEELYKQSSTTTHIDHIIPLHHDKVCGLHVLANLQAVSSSYNLSKSNIFITDWEK